MTDLNFLRPLFAAPGPWVSVYVDASRDTENARHELDLRWRHLRDGLPDVDAATLDAVGTAIADHPTRPGRYGLAVFARAGDVELVEPMPAPPPADEATVAPLPHPMPLVIARGEEIPYVRVVVDRAGADLTGVTVGSTPRRQRVTGSEQHLLHKAQSGGWSHRRHHQAVEEAWKRNAGEAAAAAADLAAWVGAEVIVVGGDPRAAQRFVERLPSVSADRVVRTEVDARHTGSDVTALDDVTVRAVAEAAERRTRAALDRYQAGLAHGTSARGLGAVVAALQRRQVDTLLLVNEPSSTDHLWIGPDDATLLALDPDQLRAQGVADPVRVRADAALLRALVGTDAGLVLVTPGEAGEVLMERGIGAVLRWADASTRAT